MTAMYFYTVLWTKYRQVPWNFNKADPCHLFGRQRKPRFQPRLPKKFKKRVPKWSSTTTISPLRCLCSACLHYTLPHHRRCY